MRIHRRCSKGFTLIELLVVIAIIAILAAILFPVFQKARAKSRTMACMANMKQLAVAFKQYHSDWDGVYVPAVSYGAPGWAWNAWPALLQKYVQEPAAFICPSANKDLIAKGGAPYTVDSLYQFYGAGPPCAYGHNYAVGGWAPVGYAPLPTEAQIPNPSRVIYLCEAVWIDVAPTLNDFNGKVMATVTRHDSGINVTCCDGHAKFVATKYLENLAKNYSNPTGTQLDTPVYFDYTRVD